MEHASRGPAESRSRRLAATAARTDDPSLRAITESTQVDPEPGTGWLLGLSEGQAVPHGLESTAELDRNCRVPFRSVGRKTP